MDGSVSGNLTGLVEIVHRLVSNGQNSNQPHLNPEALIQAPGPTYAPLTRLGGAISPLDEPYSESAPLKSSLLGSKPMLWGPSSCCAGGLPCESLNGRPRCLNRSQNGLLGVHRDHMVPLNKGLHVIFTLRFHLHGAWYPPTPSAHTQE